MDGGIEGGREGGREGEKREKGREGINLGSSSQLVVTGPQEKWKRDGGSYIPGSGRWCGNQAFPMR